MSWMVKDRALEDYLQACRDACHDLSNFKRDPRYTRILEHASYRIGAEYMENIKRDNPWLLKVPGIFDNDLFGNPVIHDYGVKASANTLQYIGVLSNLIKLYGSLTGMRIIEIGGGYGGQCLTFHKVFEPRSYEIVDLTDAINLQNNYLYQHAVAPYLSNEPPSLPKGGMWDLCISNYALSEITEPMQSEYVEKICKHSHRGYITCNQEISSLNWGNRSPDIKAERKENYIISW